MIERTDPEKTDLNRNALEDIIHLATILISNINRIKDSLEDFPYGCQLTLPFI